MGTRKWWMHAGAGTAAAVVAYFGPMMAGVAPPVSNVGELAGYGVAIVAGIVVLVPMVLPGDRGFCILVSLGAVGLLVLATFNYVVELQQRSKIYAGGRVLIGLEVRNERHAGVDPVKLLEIYGGPSEVRKIWRRESLDKSERTLFWAYLGLAASLFLVVTTLLEAKFRESGSRLRAERVAQGECLSGSDLCRTGTGHHCHRQVD